MRALLNQCICSIWSPASKNVAFRSPVEDSLGRPFRWNAVQLEPSFWLGLAWLRFSIDQHASNMGISFCIANKWARHTHTHTPTTTGTQTTIYMLHKRSSREEKLLIRMYMENHISLSAIPFLLRIFFHSILDIGRTIRSRFLSQQFSCLCSLNGERCIVGAGRPMVKLNACRICLLYRCVFVYFW